LTARSGWVPPILAFPEGSRRGSDISGQRSVKTAEIGAGADEGPKKVPAPPSSVMITSAHGERHVAPGPQRRRLAG
jgi:hypothetical protein